MSAQLLSFKDKNRIRLEKWAQEISLLKSDWECVKHISVVIINLLK